MSLLSILFSTIESSKKLGSYAIANLAFAVLLDEALNRPPKEIKFLWETQDNQDWMGYSPYENYYDIAVITDGIRSACIPAPLLKDRVAKAFMSFSQIVERKEHDRKLDWQKLPEVEQELTKLYENLIQAYPNALELAHKYLKQSCQGCPYFYGQNDVHCAPHPKGYPAQGCSDYPGFQLDIEAAKKRLKKASPMAEEDMEQPRLPLPALFWRHKFYPSMREEALKCVHFSAARKWDDTLKDYVPLDGTFFRSRDGKSAIAFTYGTPAVWWAERDASVRDAQEMLENALTAFS